MKELLKHHLYIIGFSLIIGFAIYLNWQLPPNLDEARAYTIARYLTPFEIFTISKTEGHPFLWYYVLMPFAKTHLFYPYTLYALNLTFILIAFYLFYKHAPLPTYLKYFITLSLPFLKLYNSFARCYSLTIMLSFILFYLYKNRHTKQLLYLSIILLLANTSSVGFFIASSLGIMFVYESIFHKNYKKDIKELLMIILFGLIEFTLIILQFYGYNKKIPQSTPHFGSLFENLNSAYFPLNIYILIIIYIATFFIFIKKRNFAPFFFLLLSSLQLTFLLTSIHQGGLHHYYFYYIYLICAYWITPNLSTKQLIPLIILSFSLIFNANMQYKYNDRTYLADLKNSALKINQIFKDKPQEIIIFEDFNGNIIQPYLSQNITLLNQTATPFNSLKGLEEFLYFIYVPIKKKDIIIKAQKNPHMLLFNTCGYETLYHYQLVFNLKHRLNKQYCLYDIKVN